MLHNTDLQKQEPPSDIKATPKTYRPDFEISRWGLKVGQWVQFSTDKALTDLPENLQKIYKTGRIFLVLTREDRRFDTCHCFLIDETGKTHDYCPRMNSLGYKTLLWEDDSSISVIDPEKVEGVYGKEMMLKVYQGGQKHLEEMSKYYKEYGAKKLDIQALLGTVKVAPSEAKNALQF